MCGISGKLYFDSGRPVEREILERMNAVLAHRGPDDAGIYCDGPVGLAHRRLSIIDLQPGRHQPMSNENGDVWIVFNGEIYNLSFSDPISNAGATGFAVATPKRSSTRMRRWGRVLGGSVACSRSQYGTRGAANCFSRAIA